LFSTLKWVSSIFEMRPQAMVQPKQAWLVDQVRLAVGLDAVVAMASPEMPCAHLRTGRRGGCAWAVAPISLITFISTWVP
jgi:hypothetical protein